MVTAAELSVQFAWLLSALGPASLVCNSRTSQRPGKSSYTDTGVRALWLFLVWDSPPHFSAAVLTLIFVLWFFNPEGLQVSF